MTIDSKHRVRLPETWHSAAFLDLDAAVPSTAIRWRQRKHRPAGSRLVRECLCQSESRGKLEGPGLLCPVHWLAKVVEQRGNGNSWRDGWRPFAAIAAGQAASVAEVEKWINLMSRHDVADRFSWNCIRARRATQLAVDGNKIGVIMELGEWSSRAFLRYVDTDHVDQASIPEKILGKDEGIDDLEAPTRVTVGGDSVDG